MPKLPFGDIGPCEVHWGYGYQSGDMPQIITPYLGKVMLRIADTVTDIHEEGKGVAPIDSFFEGTTIELEVPMTRSTLIQLAQTIGWQKMGILSCNVLRLDNIAGYDMYTNAETIVIKPLCNNVPDPDSHNWIVLYKCHPYRDIELGFDRNGQRIHLVKFKVFPSRDSGYEGAGGGGQYLQYGKHFKDDFCDATLKPEWNTHNTDATRTITPNPSPDCTVTIAIDGVDGRWWCNESNEAPKMYMPLGCIGPCRITTKLNSFNRGPGNIECSAAGIFIGTDPMGLADDLVYLWQRYRYDTGGPQGEVYHGLRVEGSCDSYTRIDGDVPIWLRISIDSSQVITFWYSTDGASWTQYSHKTVLGYDIPNCSVGLFVKNNIEDDCDEDESCSAIFDFFEIEICE